MKRSLLIILLIIGLALAACGAATAMPSVNQPAPGEDFARDEGGMPPSAPMPEEAPSFGGGGVAQDGVGGGVGNAQVERLVIKNASLSLTVTNPEASAAEIAALAESMGGFVVSTNVYQNFFGPNSVEAKQASMSIRVPAERLTEALDRIKGMAVEVNSENVSGQDVTAEYTDLQSRLRNLEAAEEQLQNIMDGATRTEDVLAVYSELVRVRGEIEVIQGQMQYYEESAAFSQIAIDLVPDVLTQPLDIGWQPEGVVRDALELLVQSLQGLASLLIYVAVCGLPFAIIVGGPTWLIVRNLRRRRQAKLTQATETPAAPEDKK